MSRSKKTPQAPQAPIVFMAENLEQAVAMLIAQRKKSEVFQAFFTILEKEHARRAEFRYTSDSSWSTVLTGCDDIFASLVAIEYDQDGIEEWWNDDSISLSLERMSDKRTSKV